MAAYLIRDGHIPGKNIHIFEEADQTGGSMDAHGSPETGYIMRGGRMFDEEAYTCTYDLLSFLPSLSDPNKTVKEEMFAFNQKITSSSQSRLVAHGGKVDVSSLGFRLRDRVDLIIEFKRYLLRFVQEFPRINTLAGVRRTPYNQYDAIILPLVTWLQGGFASVQGAA